MRSVCSLRWLLAFVWMAPFLSGLHLVAAGVETISFSATTSNPTAGVALSADCDLTDYAPVEELVLTCFIRVTNIDDLVLETRASFLILDNNGQKLIGQEDDLLALSGHSLEPVRLGAKLDRDESIAGYQAFPMPEELPAVLRLTFAIVAGGGKTPENETSVRMPTANFAASELQQTKEALETELAVRKTDVAPTSTNTPTPSHTPTQAPTHTPTTPPTPTVHPDELTIAALKTEIAAIDLGTPPATEPSTEIPIATVTPSATPTVRTTSTPTPTATSLDDALPESLQEYAEEDSAYGCDRIGWNAVTHDVELPDDFTDEYDHYAGCSGDLEYVASCVIAPGEWVQDEPPLGGVWITCNLVVTNLGSTPALVSPGDFRLIDARGVLQNDVQAGYGSLIEQEAFRGGQIEPGAFLQGFLLFSISEKQTSGNVLRLGDPEEMRDDRQPVIILLEPLPDATDL